MYISTLCTNNGGIGIFSPENVSKQNLQIIPNPNHGDFSFSIPAEAKHKERLVTIYNYSGQVVYRRNYHFDEDKLQLNLQPTPKGVYCITIDTESSHHMASVIIQ